MDRLATIICIIYYVLVFVGDLCFGTTTNQRLGPMQVFVGIWDFGVPPLGLIPFVTPLYLCSNDINFWVTIILGFSLEQLTVEYAQQNWPLCLPFWSPFVLKNKIKFNCLTRKCGPYDMWPHLWIRPSNSIPVLKTNKRKCSNQHHPPPIIKPSIYKYQITSYFYPNHLLPLIHCALPSP